MIKAIFIATVVVGLSACDSSNDNDNTAANNTPAVISGVTTGNITDGGAAITHALSITDPDTGEAAFTAQSNVATTYGSFSITTAGQWTYALTSNNSVVKALAEAATVTEAITVTSVDGTSSSLVITVQGINDAAVFSSGSGVDSASTLSNNATAVTGLLTVTDIDNGQGAIVAQNNIAVSYGTFSISTTGAWLYSLDTNNTQVMNLAPAATLSDVFSVSSDDATTTNITITIVGAEAEVVPPSTLSRPIGDNDSVPTVSCTNTYNTVSALTSAATFDLAAGTTLCLADGEYENDFDLAFGGIGTEQLPITVAAANPGAVIIKNSEVSVSMSGEYVVLQGFIFRDGEIDNNIIVTRGNNNIPCNYCRITEVSVIDMDDGLNNANDTTKWVEIYGSHNRVDHSWFSGKTSRGALLIVDRYIDSNVTFDPDTYEKDYAQIDHNYFGERPPIEGKAYASSSDNEYEGIRIGLSTTHSGDSFSVVEHNYFERIQGEAEVISNKASNNTIRHNTIRESYGSIVTRHGHNATIENNYIIGDDFPFSGGIRLVDDGHIVTNNYIQGARYENSNWNGGIVLTGGDGSGDGENGYQNVENVFIAHNTIVDSVNSLNVFGGNESTVPDSVYFINNIIADALGPVIKNAEDMPENSVFAGNYIYGESFSDDSNLTSMSGMNYVDAILVADSSGVYRPSDASPSLATDNAADTGTFTLPTLDMDGQTRTSSTISGADEVLTTNINRGVLTADLVGPVNYRPAPGKVHVAKVTIANHDFDSGDFAGWSNNGATLTTSTDNVFSRGTSLMLDSDTADITQTVSVIANTNYTLSAFVKGVAKLAVTVDGQTYFADQNSTDYKFTSVSFNSGNATTAVIKASVDDFVSIQAIADGDLTGFKAGENDWTTVEGDTDGDVAGSSNSASGADGSAKLGYTKPAHDNSSPSISQTVNVTANTDFDFSFAMNIKNGSVSTATLRIEGNNTVVVDNVLIDFNALTDVDLDDDFRLYSSAINSGTNTSLTVKVTYNPHTIIGDATPGSDGKLSSTTQKKNELRVDDFSLISEGTPATGTEAFFDSFRLVSHQSIVN